MPALFDSVPRRSYLIGLAVTGAISGLAATTAAMVIFSGLTGPAQLAQGAGWLAVGVVLFVCAVVSSIVGFAFSAMAGAVLFHLVPSPIEAVQIMMLASIGVQAYAVAALHRSIRWSVCLRFIAGGLAALPIGIELLLVLPAKGYLLTIGAGLIGYGLYMQLGRRPPCVTGKHTLLDIAAGAAGGITGPLAAFPSALLVIWCGARGWDKLAQRAVYQPYILVMQVVALALLCVERPEHVNPALLACVLPGLAGAVIGVRVFRALSESGFRRLISLALIGSGVGLLLK